MKHWSQPYSNGFGSKPRYSSLRVISAALTIWLVSFSFSLFSLFPGFPSPRKCSLFPAGLLNSKPWAGGSWKTLHVHHHQGMARLLWRNSGLPPPLKQFRATGFPALCPAAEGCPCYCCLAPAPAQPWGNGNRTKTTPKSTKQRWGRAVHTLLWGEEQGQGHRAATAPWAGPGGLFTVLPCARPRDSAEGTPQGFTSFRENRLPGELSQNLPQGMGR